MRNDPKHIYLSQLRNKECEQDAFRRATDKLTHLLAHDALAHLETASYDLETPFFKTTGIRISYPITLIPILRSGYALLPVFLEYFSHASIGMIGLKRDTKSGTTHNYLCSLPPLTDEHRVIILDPVIGTGGTALAALDMITEHVPQKQIIFVSILSTPDGLDAIKEKYPNVQIITAACDPELNDEKYIVPGLGDFGNRYFGTVD